MRRPILLSILVIVFAVFVRGWHHRNLGRSALQNNGRRQLKLQLRSAPKESASEGRSGSKTGEEYKNPLTKALSNLLPNEKSSTAPETTDLVASIDFEAPKISPTTSLETLARALDYELTKKEWFVTGNVNPSFFSDDFRFEDPQVKVAGIEDYSKGVRKIFDQSTARAQIVSTLINKELSTSDRPVITCKWRLSGGVNLGPGFQIKPYIVDTDFGIDPDTSLIVCQEDRFSLPSWDILLSSLFPFLVGKVTKPAASPVKKRDLTMPEIKYVRSPTRTENNISIEVLSELLQTIFPQRQ